MTDGPTDPPDDGGNPEDGPILSPEELDIGQDDHVTEIDEGRYVVSPEIRDDDGPTAGASAASGSTDSADMAGDRPGTTRPETAPEGGAESGESRAESPPPATGELSERAVHRWLERSMGESPSRYSFDVTAKFEDSITQRRMASNDVVTIFQSLVLWYAQGIDRETPVEEVLGILLMESNVPIRFPAASLQRLVSSTELDREDSIGDLLETVEERDGFRL